MTLFIFSVKGRKMSWLYILASTTPIVHHWNCMEILTTWKCDITISKFHVEFPTILQADLLHLLCVVTSHLLNVKICHFLNVIYGDQLHFKSYVVNIPILMVVCGYKPLCKDSVVISHFAGLHVIVSHFLRVYVVMMYILTVMW